jgi:protein gp37
MSENSGIEWTDHTFNPWEGCQKVGPGCDHCYAETRNARFAGGTAINWGPGAPRRRTSGKNWHKPVAWDAAHAEFFAQHGRRQRVFCASLADVFDNAVEPGWRANLLDLISKTRHLDWLILTKRIGNAQAMVPAGWFLQNPHVILGATIVNQDEADRDIPKLLAVPVHRRFLSMEPLLGKVDLMPMFEHRAEVWNDTGVDWVIVGGESGAGARPMHPAWARDLRDQCKDAGVPFLFKQWGEWAPTWTEAHAHLGFLAPMDPDGHKAIAGTRMGTYPNERIWPVVKVGKKDAGRHLDGVLHDGYPREVTP